MKKINKIYTLLMFLTAILVIWGGWHFTKYMLQLNEAKLLAKNGQLYTTGPENSDNADDPSLAYALTGSIEDHTDADFHKESLSESQIAQILTVWNAGGNFISHDPKNGQINMEQAMLAGKAWISRLVKHGLLAPGLTENSFSNVSAMLYTIDNSSDIPDHLLSQWQVTYTKDDYQICLFIHAASGQIWRAELFAAESSPAIQGSYEALLETAFSFIIGEDSEKLIQTETEKYKICKSAPEGKVYAMADDNQLAISRPGQGPFAEITFTGITLALYSF